MENTGLIKDCLLHCGVLLGFLFVAVGSTYSYSHRKWSIFLASGLHFKTLVGNALRCCQISAT